MFLINAVFALFARGIRWRDRTRRRCGFVMVQILYAFGDWRRNGVAMHGCVVDVIAMVYIHFATARRVREREDFRVALNDLAFRRIGHDCLGCC